jgi:acetylornithine deacetylase
VFGRGACDAKGQVATIYLVIAALRSLGLKLKGSLLGHLVVEEEIGGNGSLAMVRGGEKAEGCIVLEPTALRVLPSIRGAVWFRVTCAGKAGHAGSTESRSALKMAMRVIAILEDYHRKLRAASYGFPLFDKYPDPMPLTVGKLHAGNWPSAAPNRAEFEGVLGLLPNRTAAQVMTEMTEAIRSKGGPIIAENSKIEFTYHHDSSVCPMDHPLVASLQRAALRSGFAAPVEAATASCDAWFYNNQLAIPTVNFGAGSITAAHAVAECIALGELALAAETLLRTTIEWCGVGARHRSWERKR